MSGFEKREDIDSPWVTSTRDIEIAKKRAAGESYRQISAEVGLAKSRVETICKRDDVKSIIEREQKRLIELAPSALDNYKHWISKGIITNNKDEREVAFKASTKVLESTGILNGTPSAIVNILYNDNKTIISPVIMGLLSEFTKKMTAFDDVVEGEIIEEGNSEEIGEGSVA